MKNFLAAGALSILLFSPLVVFGQASDASNPATYNTTSGGQNTTSGGYNTTSGSVPNGGIGFVLQNPLNVNTICGLIKKLLGAILALGIPIAMLFLVYAGFKFVIAQGKPDKLKEAKRNIMNVIVGIGIFLGAWLLGQIIANTINAVNPGSVSGINSCN